MEDLISIITEKKKKLDRFRPLSVELVRNLDDWFRVELTYTSNAIEGNTLTRSETALVVEKGITVSGKTLTEHLEAVNHAEALDYILELAGKKKRKITERDILDIHSLILRRIDDVNSGRYRNVAVRIAGARVILPNPLKVPDLMRDFFKWLHGKHEDHPVVIASEAHLRFVTIHPFIDGNGRTARLLLNLILIQSGYLPALIRKEDRKEYIDSIALAQLEGKKDNYQCLILRAVNRSLDIYVKAINPETKDKKDYFDGKKQLLKIGELARETGESVVTIRHYTEIDLIEVIEYTDSGYQLYDRTMVGMVKKIRQLQKEKHLPLSEIRIIIGRENK